MGLTKAVSHILRTEWTVHICRVRVRDSWVAVVGWEHHLSVVSPKGRSHGSAECQTVVLSTIHHAVLGLRSIAGSLMHVHGLEAMSEGGHVDIVLTLLHAVCLVVVVSRHWVAIRERAAAISMVRFAVRVVDLGCRLGDSSHGKSS